MKRLLLFCLVNLLLGQGLFENAQQAPSNTYELSGNIKSSIQVDDDNDSLYLKGLNAQANLRIKAQKENIGYAFADIRFSSFNYSGEQVMDFMLREAYVDISFGGLNTRLGKQILPWGRADIYRSTDNITPQDMQYPYIDPDDMRMGNFLINSSLQIGNGLNIQGIWIPVYSPNLLPISAFDMPNGVQYRDITLPDREFKNSGAAIKMDLRTSEFDAAFSYLNAYSLQPGFASEMHILSSTLVTFNFFPQAWRQQVFGFDAAVNYNAWSIRCEGSYMLPENEISASYISNPEIQWTLGIDRSWKALSVLFEYNGKFVSDYYELIEPLDPSLIMDYQLAFYNRLFFRQTEEYVHNIFTRIALSMFHNTFEIEVPFSYNLSTDEYLISTRIHLDLADALRLSMGMNIYHGDEGTLFNLLKPLYNGYYCELKLSF
ncbi:MAG: hypothetical protein J7L40_01800 [Candidatus Marinimicrobia bacterium]|nr:hypothetical protein [Candidatus Neomarinimicrobiota bacterium]